MERPICKAPRWHKRGRPVLSARRKCFALLQLSYPPDRITAGPDKPAQVTEYQPRHPGCRGGGGPPGQRRFPPLSRAALHSSPRPERSPGPVMFQARLLASLSKGPLKTKIWFGKLLHYRILKLGLLVIPRVPSTKVINIIRSGGPERGLKRDYTTKGGPLN